MTNIEILPKSFTILHNVNISKEKIFPMQEKLSIPISIANEKAIDNNYLSNNFSYDAKKYSKQVDPKKDFKESLSLCDNIDVAGLLEDKNSIYHLGPSVRLFCTLINLQIKTIDEAKYFVNDPSPICDQHGILIDNSVLDELNNLLYNHKIKK